MRIETVVTAHHTGAFVAELTLMNAQTVSTIFGTVDSSGVITILIHFRLRNEITIFRTVRAVGVVGVDVQVGVHKQTKMRDLLTHLFELIEEGPIEIEVTAEV